MMIKKIIYKAVFVFMVSRTRQLSTFFLEFPLYSAPRTNLLSSAACIFDDRWSLMSKAEFVSVFLFGSLLLPPEQNND